MYFQQPDLVYFGWLNSAVENGFLENQPFSPQPQANHAGADKPVVELPGWPAKALALSVVGKEAAGGSWMDPKVVPAIDRASINRSCPVMALGHIGQGKPPLPNTSVLGGWGSPLPRSNPDHLKIGH